MKRSSLFLGAIALVGLLVMGSSALAYNTPTTASRDQTYLVPAYNQCNSPSLTHQPALTLPACAPAATTDNNPANSITFVQNPGTSAYARVQIVRSSGGPVVRVVAKGIRNNGGPYTGNLSVQENVRLTDNGCGGGSSDCTVIDFPFPVSVSVTGGNIKATTSLNTVVPGASVNGDKEILQLGQIQLMDPDGDAAMTSGIFQP